jgi:phage protein D
VHFANPGLRWLDNPLFDLRNSVELSLGYRPGNLVHVFKGEVSSIEPVFPAGGMPSVTIAAHDYMFRLTQGTKERAFPWYLPDSLIAVIVAAENFLITDPDPAAAVVGALNVFNQRPRAQYKQTDFELMRQIATQYGFDMWVDGDVMNFKFLLPGLPGPQVELAWGESLVEFSPKYTSIGQLLAVGVKVWIQEIKTELMIQATWDGDSVGVRVMPALLGEMSETIQPMLSLPDIPLDNPIDAITWVLGDLRRRINNRTTGKGVAIGDPRLRIGQVIALSGLGSYSGTNWRLTSVSHTVDRGGYKTGFEVRKELV